MHDSKFEDIGPLLEIIKARLGDTEGATKSLLVVAAVSAAVSLKRQADAADRIAVSLEAIADVLGHPIKVRES